MTGAPRARVLVVSTMFPNPAQPVHAVFVLRRVSRAAEHCDVDVVAPVPWFPFATRLRRYAYRRAIPTRAVIGGLTVHYPRFLSVPRFLRPLDGWSLFLTLRSIERRLRNGRRFDLIDAHLAWPDGFAAVQLGATLKTPVTLTLRGHDINVLPAFPGRRRQIIAALRGANRVMAVADALRRAAVDLGCPADRTETIPNGVETTLFQPGDRLEARRELGLPLDRPIVVSVGHLVERKGYHLVLEAMRRLAPAGPPPFHYVVVGAPGEEGNFLPTLQRRIAELDLADHVTLAGAVANDRLSRWYVAADVSCLASEKEGWANVLLESLACGTPVVATRVWGTPEVINSPAYGVLVDRTADSIASGLASGLATAWNREVLVTYARSFSWDDVGRRVADNYRCAIAEGPIQPL